VTAAQRRLARLGRHGDRPARRHRRRRSGGYRDLAPPPSPAGSAVRVAGEEGPHLELLVSGFVRIFVSAPDGRSLTVRYFRPGALTGVASLFTPKFSMPGSIQALRDSDLLVFRTDVVRSLVDRDLDIARALLDELAERVVDWVVDPARDGDRAGSVHRMSGTCSVP
jgi:CRP-like cAMP-binding protein